MNTLVCLGAESIKLLDSNNLLIPLIKKELIKDRIKSINVDSKEKEKLIQQVWDKKNIKNETEYNQWLIASNQNKEKWGTYQLWQFIKKN